jgi:hypothetical protein
VAIGFVGGGAELHPDQCTARSCGLADPESLPPHFRNHCTFDVIRGRWSCSNHCGLDYQFYFCSPASFGCCHPGYGYCDWNGSLRCAP